MKSTEYQLFMLLNQPAPLWLHKANLSGKDLCGAFLSGADLSGAILSGADLSGADLRRAILNGADLNGAEYTKRTKRTIWPNDEFDPEAAGAKCVDVGNTF